MTYVQQAENTTMMTEPTPNAGDDPMKMPFSAAELEQQLAMARQADVQLCADEIRQSLAKWRCELFANPQYTDDGRTVAIPGVRPVRTQP